MHIPSTPRHHWFLWLGTWMLLLSSSSWASAQSHDTSGVAWQQGVAPEAREQALRLFRAGNDHFVQSEYSDAVTRYRAALKVWNHPRIHGNLAIALMHLDAPLEAFEHLDAALRHGAAPFDDHVYQRLLMSRELLLEQLARVEVRCSASGATITINGGVMFTCPGREARMMLAGDHQLVAQKPGYLTFTRAFTAVGGTITAIDVEQIPLAAMARYERRWATWRPWAVTGAGALTVGLGVIFQRESLDTRSQYEAEIAQLCPGGCEVVALPGAVQDLEGRTRMWNRLAIGALAAGSAALLTGASMLYLNRERRIDLDESGHRISAVVLHSSELSGLAVVGLF